MAQKNDINVTPGDALVNLMLIAVGLTVVIVMVAVCLPKDGNLARGWKQGWAQMNKQVKTMTSAMTHKAENKATEQILTHTKLPTLEQTGRAMVSYNDPRVMRTMDVPWR